MTAYCLLSTTLFLIRFVSYPVTSHDWWMGWATLGLGFEVHLLCNWLAFRINELLAIDLASSVVSLCIWHVSVVLNICGSLWMLGMTLINRIGRYTAQTSLATTYQSIERQTTSRASDGDKPPC